LGDVPNGTRVDTSATGVNNFKVIATSTDGQTVTTTVTYTVLPDNRLVGRPKVKRQADGALIVTVRVPGPGELYAVALAPKRDLAAASTRLLSAQGYFAFAQTAMVARRASALRLVLRPMGRGRALVARHHLVAFRIRITFKPKGGSPRTASYSIVRLP
jgi:hypothetical protein